MNAATQSDGSRPLLFRVNKSHPGRLVGTAEVPPKVAVVLRRTATSGSLPLAPVDLSVWPAQGFVGLDRIGEHRELALFF